MSKDQNKDQKLLDNLESEINHQMWEGTLPSFGLVHILRDESFVGHIVMLTGPAALGYIQHYSAVGIATVKALSLTKPSTVEEVESCLEALLAKPDLPPEIGSPVDADGIPLVKGGIYTVDFSERDASVVFVSAFTRYTVNVIFEGDTEWINIETWRLHKKASTQDIGEIVS